LVYNTGTGLCLHARFCVAIFALYEQYAQTSKKDRQNTGPYCLPRLRDIFVSVDHAKIMAPNIAPKKKQNNNIPMAKP
jgi:hypothetical protein